MLPNARGYPQSSREGRMGERWRVQLSKPADHPRLAYPALIVTNVKLHPT